MPVLQVHFPAGSLIDERKAALAQRLTDVLLAMEGGAKTEGGPCVCDGSVYGGPKVRLVGRWKHRLDPCRAAGKIPGARLGAGRLHELQPEERRAFGSERRHLRRR